MTFLSLSAGLGNSYLWVVQSLAQALMNKVLFIVLSHFSRVLCLLVHARYISKYILTHRKVKIKNFFFYLLFYFSYNGIQVFLKKHSNVGTFFKGGTKHTLVVGLKIALSRLKFLSLCWLGSAFQNLMFSQILIPMVGKYHSFGILSLLGTFHIFLKKKENLLCM